MLWDEFYDKLSVRAKKALTRRQVNSFRELAKMNEYELGLIPGCGEGTAREIAGAFRSDGREFDSDLCQPDPQKEQDLQEFLTAATEAIREARELREYFERVRLVLPIRDLFAAAALSSLMLGCSFNRVSQANDELAEGAYRFADAMMAARSKNRGG